MEPEVAVNDRVPFAFTILGMILYFVYVIFHFARSKTLAQTDGSYIYLIHLTRKDQILIKDIQSVIPRRSRAKSIAYTFGKLIIKTKPVSLVYQV